MIAIGRLIIGGPTASSSIIGAHDAINMVDMDTADTADLILVQMEPRDGHRWMQMDGFNIWAEIWHSHP